MLNRTMGDKIRELREGLDLTQDEASEVADISQPTWSRYEADRVVRINKEHIQKISSALRTTPEYLLDYDNEFSHLPDYLRNFVANPKNIDFLKRAFIEYVQQ